MTIQLMIVDDHALVREGLRLTFESTEIAVVAEAADGFAAFEAIQARQVDVAIVDLQMPRADGMSFLEMIRAANVAVSVLVHSILSSPATIRRCRELGARGFLIKGVDQDLLVAAVLAVSAGEEWWPKM